ncbi:Regulator of V-ATPase in vacuolar membrane protein 1 [Colletotrichum scovillei]|nr:Regulator of V-ATPase in vacuolar membrane protein 1 [Colletotrichum scovillei]KAG7080859.1 Regulator of V-ATPase in vacuolar membrane protein 1 [Colletotrichum scovillei]
MPSLPHRPVLAPRDGISSFVSVQSSDSYYSDHEIAILHRVVTAAQENLELLPEGERLATNALFQAYDAVLPLFGIDPEEENHISRLVFRVGGERGEGSLQEKLDAVLSRMGIGLEFGSEGSRALSNNGDDDNEDEDGAGAGYAEAAAPQPALTDTDRDSVTSGDESSKEVELAPREPYANLPSSKAQASHRLDYAASPPRLTRVGLVSNHLDLKSINHNKPAPQSYTPSTAGNTEQSRQSRQSVSGTSVQRGASDTTVQPIEASYIHPANETEAAALPIRTKPIRTVNWLLPPDTTSISAGTSVGATAPEPVRNGPRGSEVAEDHVVHVTETRNSHEHELNTQKPSVHTPAVHECTVQKIATHQATKRKQPAEEPSVGRIESDEAKPVIDDEINGDPDDDARYAVLEWKSTKVYITGSAFTILGDADTIVQTIYDDDPSHLQAAAFDESSGKIATCTESVIRVYRPFGQSENALKWGLQSSCPVPGHQHATKGVSLSWGGNEELLVAHSALYLYSTADEPELLWTKHLPNSVRLAEISYDSAYIACVGAHDCLVKVWRRLTYGAGDVRFNLTYLRHPDLVTSLRWRKPLHTDQTVENVLFTTCADNVVRVWTGTDTHAFRHMNLWGSVDLASSFRDLGLGSADPTAPLVTFVIDGREVSAATELAVQRCSVKDKPRDAALERLISLANNSAELCVASDASGNMMVFAFEDVGSKAGKSHDAIRVTGFKSHTLDFRSDQYVSIQSYCDRATGRLHVLVHDFDGQIQVYDADLAEFLSGRNKPSRLARRCIWAGHSSPIQKMVRNFSGRAVVSRTEEGESIVWTHSETSQTSLSRQSVIQGNAHIHRICVLRKGRFVIFLEHGKISLWDCRHQKAILLASQSYDISGKPLCLLILPRHRVEEYAVAHIATVTSEEEGLVWEVNLPRYSSQGVNTHANGQEETSISEFCRFKLKDAEGIAYMLPVDPAGSTPATSGFLDVFARDIAVSYTHAGRVDFWTARVGNTGKSVGWLSTSSAETGLVEPALVSGSTLKKAAIVDSARSQLFIWDIGGARLEFTQDYGRHNTIQDLDWTSTPDSQSILAVGFQAKVVLLSQMRFDYLNKGPAWAAVREISIREFTPHPIGDSTWLGDGHLVIGSGNQMFVHGREYDLSGSLINSLQLPHRKNGVWDLFDAVQRFNGPLPVFHPQFLSQCILAGKSTIVRTILMSLHKTLKFLIAGETVDDYLGLEPAVFYSPGASPTQASESQVGSHFSLQVSADETDDSEEHFSEETALAINGRLTKVGLQQLSGHEQIQLADIVECVGIVEKQRRSLDENGARFMLFFRQHGLRKGRTSEIQMSWREINWAYHSTSQDILTDFVSKQCHGALRWADARESGMFMWLTDRNALLAQFEVVARNEYTKSEMKNPVDCSIYYLALKKKTVLQGLWRMAHWNREQGATQKLLSNNFEDPKWRTTALKNAYALLSKRRFEYAAAFFLLADHLQDAVNVCLNQLKDLQLAVAIARVYEGDRGPVLKKLLEEEVLAVAAKEGNRWLASWAFWMLNRKDMAVRALISPVYTLVETPCSPNMQSKLFLTDDPALVVLYSQLRQKTLQTLRGASKITPRVEWEFVLHSAKLYDRMGCDLLGLDLVRNWEFLKPAPLITNGLGGEVNPLKLLRRRSSLVVADLPVSKLHSEMRSSGQERQSTPTVFQEPDSSSLLDSFGF